MPVILHVLSAKERKCLDLVNRDCLTRADEPNGEPFIEGPLPTPRPRMFGLLRQRPPEKQPVTNLEELWFTYGYPSYPRRTGQGSFAPIHRAELLCRWLSILYDDQPALVRQVADSLDTGIREQAKVKASIAGQGGHIMHRDLVDTCARKLSHDLPRWKG